jgi:hypothetical protein
MSGTAPPSVIVASKLPMAVQIRSDDRQSTCVIVGERDPGAVNGYGITYDVDQTVLEEWLASNPDMAAFVRITTEDEIAHHADPMNTHGYELGLEAAAPPEPPSAPPVNRDVPYAEQRGSILNCTMGNWNNVPDSYAYQWQIDGDDVGTNAADYTVTPGDVGKSAVCVVTATNALGSTAAPPSNSVTIA